MWLIGDIKVWLYPKPVDMRKNMNGLSMMIADTLAKNLMVAGEVYIFYNKGKDKIKLLYWDRNGFVLLYKRLKNIILSSPKWIRLKQLGLSVMSN